MGLELAWMFESLRSDAIERYDAGVGGKVPLGTAGELLFVHGGHGGTRRTAFGSAEGAENGFFPRRARRDTENCFWVRGGRGERLFSTEGTEEHGELLWVHGQRLFVRGGRGGARRTALGPRRARRDTENGFGGSFTILTNWA